MKKLVQLWRESLSVESRASYEHQIMELAVKHHVTQTFKTWMAWWKADSREQRSWVLKRGFAALGLRGNLSEAANAKNKREGCVSLIERIRIFGAEQLAACAAAKYGARLGTGPSRHDLERRQAALVGRTAHQELLWVFDDTASANAPPATGAGAAASVVTAYDSFRSTPPKPGTKGPVRFRNNERVNTRPTSTTQLDANIERATRALQNGQLIVSSKLTHITTGAGAAGAGPQGTGVSAVEFELPSTTDSAVVYTCRISREPTCTCPAWLETGLSFVPSMTTVALHAPTY
jgi:hypothetical protein